MSAAAHTPMYARPTELHEHTEYCEGVEAAGDCTPVYAAADYDALAELVGGAILLLNGDCPLTETNCDEWLARARAALASKEQGK